VQLSDEWTLIEYRGTDNILFNLPFNEKRYLKTLEVECFVFFVK
jgi:hypothetical protein